MRKAKTMSEKFPNGYLPSAQGALAITPSDTVDHAKIRLVTIGGTAGTLSFISLDGETNTTGILQPGNYPVETRRILATGTTATDITGWI